MIKIDNIEKSFGTIDVLRGVSLEVKQGQILGIVGKSGAGKTTLLQIMGTLLTPDKGSVIIDGIDVFTLNSDKLAEFRNKHIGFIFQFHQLLSEFTAVENVMMPALIAGEDYKKSKERALTLLADLGLTQRSEHKPQQLSGGEKQRVAAARAMMMQPSVILADEPSGSLDSQNKDDLHRLLLEMKNKYGQTIVLVTHDKETAKIADQVVEMKDGKIVE